MVDDPLALLDAVIRDMESQRAEALPVLSRAEGVQAEALFKAIKTLDDKLVEARAKRAELVRRRGRIARLQEITTTLRGLREELTSGVADPTRRAHLEDLGRALAAEATALVAEGKKTRQP